MHGWLKDKLNQYLGQTLLKPFCTWCIPTNFTWKLDELFHCGVSESVELQDVIHVSLGVTSTKSRLRYFSSSNIWPAHALDLEIPEEAVRECVRLGANVEEDNIAHVALDLENIVATPEDYDSPIVDRGETIEVHIYIERVLQIASKDYV